MVSVMPDYRYMMVGITLALRLWEGKVEGKVGLLGQAGQAGHGGLSRLVSQILILVGIFLGRRGKQKNERS